MMGKQLHGHPVTIVTGVWSELAAAANTRRVTFPR
jgi:hypothetical protein